VIELAKVFHALGDVRVRVHDAGHHPFIRKVDNFAILGDYDIRADFHDFFVFYENDLVFCDRAVGGINQVSRADCDGLRARGNGHKEAQREQPLTHFLSSISVS
jgi:hypothetical protein